MSNQNKQTQHLRAAALRISAQRIATNYSSGTAPHMPFSAPANGTAKTTMQVDQ